MPWRHRASWAARSCPCGQYVSGCHCATLSTCSHKFFNVYLVLSQTLDLRPAAGIKGCHFAFYVHIYFLSLGKEEEETMACFALQQTRPPKRTNKKLFAYQKLETTHFTSGHKSWTLSQLEERVSK